jgi:hypothetical protein
MRGYFMNKEERKAYDKSYRQANKEKQRALQKSSKDPVEFMQSKGFIF